MADNDGEDDDRLPENAFRYVSKGPRNRFVVSVIQEKIDVRVRRLGRLDAAIAAQEAKIAQARQKFLEAEAAGGKTCRKESLKASAERMLTDLKKRAEKAVREIELLKSNDGWINAIDSKVSEDAVQSVVEFAEDRKLIVDAARRWAGEHGVKGFVDTVDVDGEEIGVIRMHMAQYANTKPVDGVWPAFFTFQDTIGSGADKREQAVKDLLACATPDMERMVGILTTPGMLHMVDLEALTLRGHVVEVSNDPEVREKGLDLLKDFVVVDAEAYTKNFKK